MDDLSGMSIEGMQCIIGVYENDIKEIDKQNPFGGSLPEFRITWRVQRIIALRAEIDRRLDMIPIETLMNAIDGNIQLTII